MRYTWTVPALLNLTGFTYEFLQRFIPNPLKPVEWDRWSDQKRLERVAKAQLSFNKNSVEAMVRIICQEYHRQLGVGEEMNALQNSMSRLEIVLYEIRRGLKYYTDVVTLKEIALRTQMTAGHLRKMLKNKQTDEQGIQRAFLELRGMTLPMFKRDRGDWVCHRLEFINQWRNLTIPQYDYWL